MSTNSINTNYVNSVVPCSSPSFTINMPSISATTHYLSFTNTEIPFTAITTTKNYPSL